MKLAASRTGRVAATVVAAAILIGSCGGSPPERGTAASATAPTRAAAAPPAATGLSGRIAYSTQEGDVWVMQADGSGRRRVTHSATGTDFDPSWAPDGRRLVFRSTRGRHLPDPASLGLDSIFVIGVDGSGERAIHPPTGGLFPDWSPDGSAIAFSGVLRPGGRTDHVHLMRPDGTGVRAVRPDLQAECIQWSPDAGKLLFCSRVGADDAEVWVMGANGSRPRRLTDAPGDDYPGVWSPDGRRIAFSSKRDGNGEVYVMNADGSGQTRLTTSPDSFEAPNAWLPDGTIVVASSREDDPLPTWLLLGPDGSNVRSLPQLRGAVDPIDWLW